MDVPRGPARRLASRARCASVMPGSLIMAMRGAGRLAGMIESLKIYWAETEGSPTIARNQRLRSRTGAHRVIQHNGQKSAARRLLDGRRHFHQSAIDHVQSLGGSERKIEYAAPR